MTIHRGENKAHRLTAASSNSQGSTKTCGGTLYVIAIFELFSTVSVLSIIRRKFFMHLLEENSLWESNSEFVTPDGKIMSATGETEITIDGNKIENKSWAMLNETKIENFYSITKITENKYSFVSENPSLGTQKGIFTVDRNTVFSKFQIEDSDMNGFEVIIRNSDTCTVYGALYNQNELINSWNASMKRMEK